ncbi:ATPase [Candidatus Shapirobacteria bacterium CG03_land_8_20_14_0_80_35_14]|uniref:ATPase n=4 Tax=Candidatus Shapironibacteriota TaxID=1752721 RepID=A0A2M7BQT4_9BACT|nr:MAG: ATPase [Candidatus Shapirobacteria bacterium CG03_land_8_20_14_0_80_35_14]PIX67974.1 MAG: ATPase [Candidatus Shapirobacteria bacterium CG_4_10_14_3_um_filter_35_13]
MIMIIKFRRKIEDRIKKYLFKGDAIVIYGARQVGKTTLVNKILAEYGDDGKYYNCELKENRDLLQTTNSQDLGRLVSKYKIVVLDEAQKITDIGTILKILVDTFPKVQIIATGSSSFDLANKINEPMTGRTKTFSLYPLAIEELIENYDFAQINGNLENILRFGLYPKVFDRNAEESIMELSELTNKYLYRDILSFNQIRKSTLVEDLLKLVALQVGSEVSYEELSVKLGVDRLTVIKYLDILEQMFVIFSLRAFSRNIRDEVSKSIKIYFWDVGIRNAILGLYNNLSVRDDVGKLWENFCIVERMKYNANNFILGNVYFWRTYDQKEIDYIEEINGEINGYEFKWGDNTKIRGKGKFEETYGGKAMIINRKNYLDFLIKKMVEKK